MIKPDISTSHLSPGQIVWKKFIRNRPSIIAMGWIILNILISIAGYTITPDPTPNANRQHLEIAASNPGTRINFINVMKNGDQKTRSGLSKMVLGAPDIFTEIPYSAITFKDDLVIIDKYSGDENYKGPELALKMADVIFNIDSTETQNGTAIIYLNGNNGTISKPVGELEYTIKQKHIHSRSYFLGTDRFGRDILSQVIIGGRVSLSVGFVAITIALILGIVMGSLAGFFRGRTDQIIIWFINVVWSIPTLLLVIAITFALGKGFWQIFIAVGLTMWVDVARVVRGQIISLRENEYIEAARALGIPALQIIRKHLLPNIVGPVVVISAANFASAILIEAGLSFLGIGVQPPTPSWGTMIRENYGFIILDKAFLAIIPGICIMLLVMAFMVAGNGLRDALDKTSANQ